MARALVAAGLVIGGWLAGLEVLGISGSSDSLFPAVLAGMGALLAASEARRRSRHLVLALRAEGLGIYRRGALVGSCAWTEVQLHAPSGDATFYRLLFPLAGAVAGGAMVPRLGTTGVVGVTCLTVLLVAVSASIVHVRHVCMKFAIPLEGKRRFLAVRKRDGDALLAVMPKAGGWRVAE